MSAPHIHEPIPLHPPRHAPLRLAGGTVIAHYQPVIEVASGRLVGAEALARLCGPDGAVTPAGSWLPGLTGTELTQVDEAVLHHALGALRAWTRQRGTASFAVAVNLSAGSLADSEVVDVFARACALHDVDPAWVTLEVTEHDELPAGAGEVVDQLRFEGFAIAIDDFGAGHSTFGSLLDLAADYLKLDRKLVTASVETTLAQRIIGATVDVAHSVGMRVVAEGVETAAELETVVGLECDLIQGWYYSPALAVEQLDARYPVDRV